MTPQSRSPRLAWVVAASFFLGVGVTGGALGVWPVQGVGGHGTAPLRTSATHLYLSISAGAAQGYQVRSPSLASRAQGSV